MNVSQDSKTKNPRQTPNINANMQDLLKNWCDQTLRPGQCYGSDKTPFTRPPEEGELVYQDGTACSASHAMSDVYELTDGTFLVCTDIGQARCMGGEFEMDIVTTKCKTIVDVLDELLRFCGHDPNTTGDLLNALCKKLKIGVEKQASRGDVSMSDLLKRSETDIEFKKKFEETLECMSSLAYNK